MHALSFSKQLQIAVSARERVMLVMAEEEDVRGGDSETGDGLKGRAKTLPYRSPRDSKDFNASTTRECAMVTARSPLQVRRHSATATFFATCAGSPL